MIYIIRKVLQINYLLQEKLTAVYSQKMIISVSLAYLKVMLRDFSLILVLRATLYKHYFLWKQAFCTGIFSEI